MNTPASKALLVILDGFGISENPDVSAISKANTPFIDSLFEHYPNNYLLAGEEYAGLPEGQFGNSEVGHLNIGAGRIVWQELSRINKDIRDGAFFDNPTLLEACKKASATNRIHLMGLFSDGGVHSHNQHMYALLKLCKMQGIEHVFVHGFFDGRDTSPHGGSRYVKEFQENAAKIGVGKLSSAIGRYFAMDRDNRWERVQQAYDLLLKGFGKNSDNPIEAIEACYREGKTDEFLPGMTFGDAEASRIRENDVVIFFNFRGDRAREITNALTQTGFEFFPVEKLNLHYVCFTNYDSTFKNVSVAFPPVPLENTLGEWISKQGLAQFRIAETEKYPHVTYFFNGGIEEPNKGEERLMIPSPKVATYDLQPEMSAPEVADALCSKLNEQKFHLAILNFANPDMVGHTGVMEAAIKAVETIDIQLKKVIETARKNGYRCLVIADHGNADVMINPDGSAHTAHTLAPVPVILITEKSGIHLNSGILADVAPTILKMMDVPQPKQMTGKALF